MFYKNKHPLIIWLLFSVLMAITYTQSPLFTSNQNQYFLHGMAAVEMGSLPLDWIANTAEPTPVFTWIVQFTYLIFKTQVFFYVYYAFLMGLYLFSLYHIANQLFGLSESNELSTLWIGCILALQSAGFRYLSSSTLGTQWSFLFDGGMAGQRVLGTVFQPSTFGVFLLFSFLQFLRDKKIQAIVFATLAASIHPTYLLTSALLVGGYLLYEWFHQKNLKNAVLLGILALLLIAPILVYVLKNFEGSEFAQEARRILIEIRIPHHSSIQSWFGFPSVVKLTMILWGIYLLRSKPEIFYPFTFIAVASIALSAVQYFYPSDFMALIFPWRPSAILMPIAFGCITAHLLTILINIHKKNKPIFKPLGKIIPILLITLSGAAGIYRMGYDYHQKIQMKEKNLYAWIEQETGDQDRFVIPVGLETFRTETKRAAFIDFFAIPYNHEDVIHWYHRVLGVNKFFDTGNCSELFFIYGEEPYSYIITTRNDAPVECWDHQLVYQDNDYLVYKRIG